MSEHSGGKSSALIAAGVRMLDQHVAACFARASKCAGHNVFTNLVQTEAAVGTNTTKWFLWQFA